MEYIITASGPFAEIEEQVIRALEQHGLVVRKTFSLHSAAGGDVNSTEGRPGYCVLMLYAAEADCPPLGLITLYERQGEIVIQATAARAAGPPLRAADAEAELVAALTVGGLGLRDHGGGACWTASLDEG